MLFQPQSSGTGIRIVQTADAGCGAELPGFCGQIPKELILGGRVGLADVSGEIIPGQIAELS